MAHRNYTTHRLLQAMIILLTLPPGAGLLAQSAGGSLAPLTNRAGLRYNLIAPELAMERALEPEKYLVGPGDIFVILIRGVNSYIATVSILPEEKIIVPEVGTVLTTGLTAAEVSARVKRDIRRVYPSAEAECILYTLRKIRVGLAGAVNNPAFYTILPKSRLSDMLAIAGGANGLAALHRIEIHHADGRSSTYDYTSFLTAGNLSTNPLLFSGDQIVVPFSSISEEMISVQGLGNTPAYYPFRPGESLATFIHRWYGAKQLSEIASVNINAGSSGDFTHIEAKQFGEITLEAGSQIYIRKIPGVNVLGEVNLPGYFPFQPGMMANDYIVEAGGISRDGSLVNIRVTRQNGKKDRGGDEPIHAGDVIYVGRSYRASLVGNAGWVQVGLAVLNMALIVASRL